MAWAQPTRGVAPHCQVNENAKQDLKEGLLLYNTENNVGLKNAWNIIQAEVRSGLCMVWNGAGHSGPGLLGEPPLLGICLDLRHQMIPWDATGEG